MAKYARNIPFNDLPWLSPSKTVDNDTDILKKLGTASRALATVNSNIISMMT
jgi:hypothetical protein